jgi:ribose transport system ATP-binding protein
MTLRVTNLSKSYSGVPVLQGVDLEVADGEIHALLGANGAGKSTLIKCISGAIHPDAGEIAIGEERFGSLTPRQSQRAGVAVIYQELSLAGTLNVYENVFLGHELRWGPFVRRRAQRNEAAHWLQQIGVSVDASAPLVQLSNAELQVVEIVKALRGRPRVLILDEPTASLTEHEAEQLGQHMLALKRQRLPLLYVTHRLGEVFTLADRVTVLRGGEVILSGAVKDLTREALVTAIAGRSIGPRGESAELSEPQPDAVRLSVRGLVSPGIGPIDLDVHAGEILGVFGLVGSGRTELLETLFGARRMHGGTVSIDGERLSADSPPAAVSAGIALVPSDRLRKSLLGSLTALENAMLPSFSRLARSGIRRRRGERQAFDGLANRLNLQPRRPDLEARRFSGGNQQKLVIGRWLPREKAECRVLLLDEPTQGVDVGARTDLYAVLRAFADEGRAVVVTSSEPEELMQIADRVAVLSRGRLVGTVRGAALDERTLLRLAHLEEGQEDNVYSEVGQK